MKKKAKLKPAAKKLHANAMKAASALGEAIEAIALRLDTLAAATQGGQPGDENRLYEATRAEMKSLADAVRALKG